jgi:hypothetical protein
MQAIFAIGDISRALGVAPHRVLYLLRTRPHIQPIGRVGSNRAYDAEAVRLVAQELHNDLRRRLF